MSERPGDPKPRPWFRTDVRTLLVLVACVALVLWSWRTLSDTDPLRAAARRVESGREDDRLHAVLTLGGAEADEADVAMPALLGALGDESLAVRRAAFQGVVHLADLVTQAVPPRGTTPPTRAQVAGHLKTVTDVLLHELRGRDDWVRAAAAAAFLTLLNKPVVIDLVGPRRDTREAIRDALLVALNDPMSEVRELASGALGALGTTIEEPPPEALAAMLRDPSAPVRKAAAGAVVRFKGPVDAVLPELFRGLEEDVTTDDRQACYYALCRARPTHEFLPDLVARLSGPNRMARGTACIMLGNYGPVAEEAAPALLGAFRRSRDEVAAGAVEEPFAEPMVQSASALAKVAPDRPVVRATLVPELIEALKSENPRIVGLACRSLFNLGPAAEPAVPALIAVLGRGEPADAVRTNAALALVEAAKQTPSAPRALAALRAGLKDGRMHGLSPEHVRRMLVPLEPTDEPPTKPAPTP